MALDALQRPGSSSAARAGAIDLQRSSLHQGLGGVLPAGPATPGRSMPAGACGRAACKTVASRLQFAGQLSSGGTSAVQALPAGGGAMLNSPHGDRLMQDSVRRPSKGLLAGAGASHLLGIGGVTGRQPVAASAMGGLDAKAAAVAPAPEKQTSSRNWTPTGVASGVASSLTSPPSVAASRSGSKQSVGFSPAAVNVSSSTAAGLSIVTATAASPVHTSSGEEASASALPTSTSSWVPATSSSACPARRSSVSAYPSTAAAPKVAVKEAEKQNTNWSLNGLTSEDFERQISPQEFGPSFDISVGASEADTFERHTSPHSPDLSALELEVDGSSFARHTSPLDPESRPSLTREVLETYAFQRQISPQAAEEVLHPFDLTQKLQELGLSYTEAREAASRVGTKTVDCAIEWHLEHAGANQAAEQARRREAASACNEGGCRSRSSSVGSRDCLHGNGGEVSID